MAFLQDTYRIDNGRGFFSLNGGVRVSYWDFNRELLISPRLNIGYVPQAAATGRSDLPRDYTISHHFTRSFDAL